MSERLHALSLIAPLAVLRLGTTTSENLTRALLDCIAAGDANVQAWAYLDTAAARDVERRSDGEHAGDSATGLLAAHLPFGGLL